MAVRRIINRSDCFVKYKNILKCHKIQRDNGLIFRRYNETVIELNYTKYPISYHNLIIHGTKVKSVNEHQTDSGGLYSTEEAITFRTQQPWVRLSGLPNIFFRY